MKLVMDMPGGDNIKAFTRIMHRTSDDDLVGEVSSSATSASTAVLQHIKSPKPLSGLWLCRAAAWRLLTEFSGCLV